MPGVNLSQPVAEEEEVKRSRGFFDTGIIVSLVLLALSGSVWGGMRLYLGSLDKKIATLDETLSANAERLKGEGVNRVADFDARVTYYAEHRDGLTDPRDILRRLESVMVPGIVLTSFTYDNQARTSIIAGRSEDFRKMAEQILSLKAEKIFSQVVVDRIERDDKDRITFVFKANF